MNMEKDCISREKPGGMEFLEDGRDCMKWRKLLKDIMHHHISGDPDSTRANNTETLNIHASEGSNHRCFNGS